MKKMHFTRPETELPCFGKSIFTKKIVTTESSCTFDLGLEKIIEVPKYLIVGFMPSGQISFRTQNNDTFL